MNTNEQKQMNIEEVAFIVSDVEKNSSVNEVWIWDSGCSNHMTNNKYGMYNLHEHNKNTMVANGSNMEWKLIGDLDVLVKKEGGTMIKVVLKDVHYMEELANNLFSINTMRNKDIFL